jgi:hypothetical protein
MQTKVTDPVFDMAHRAILKIHPDYRFFLEDLLARIHPLLEGRKSQEKAQFLHIVYYEEKDKLRGILTDVFEIFGWQSQTIFLVESQDIYRPGTHSQGMAFQESHPKFPDVVVTDLLKEFFWDLVMHDEVCSVGKQLLKFLQEKEELNFLECASKASDARGSLIINVIPSAGLEERVGTESFLRFLYKHPLVDMDDFRIRYVPQHLETLIKKEVLLREDLLFFAKDDFYKLQLAFDLMSLRSIVEHRGNEILGIPVHVSVEALCYFQTYIAHKKLSYRNLKNSALDFFDPVFRQYPRFAMKLPELGLNELELDFEGGWRFKASIEKS